MSDNESLQSELKLNTQQLAQRLHKDEDNHIDKTESDSDISDGGGESDGNSEEYDEYDLTDNPLYQVLSAFLEDDDGNNLCDHICKLTEAVQENTTKLHKLLESTSGSKQIKQIKQVKQSKDSKDSQTRRRKKV
jgi:hypothetical protein